MSHKSVLQECPTRVSYKSVPQECPTRVSYKSVPQECPTRVSHKSVLQECHLDILYSFSNVFAFGFVGSIFFSAPGAQMPEEGRMPSCKRMAAHGNGPGLNFPPGSFFIYVFPRWSDQQRQIMTNCCYHLRNQETCGLHSSRMHSIFNRAVMSSRPCQTFTCSDACSMFTVHVQANPNMNQFAGPVKP